MKTFIHDESIRFLELSQALWGASSTASQSKLSALFATSNSEKLQGRFSWPFAFALPRKLLPRTTEAKRLGISAEEALPPSLEGVSIHSICYEISVEVRRSGIINVFNE